jgi:uncharacterized protein YlxW (UPF0749 family)
MEQITDLLDLPDSLQKKNKLLQTKNKTLQTENDSLKAENNLLKAENDLLQTQIESLQSEKEMDFNSLIENELINVKNELEENCIIGKLSKLTIQSIAKKKIEILEALLKLYN